MEKESRRIAIIAVAAALVVGLGACGSGDDDGADLADDLADAASADTSLDDLDSVTIPDLFAATEFDEAPGRIRFLSVVSESGTPLSLDIYWGGPSSVTTNEPATTIEYGVASDYLTPMRPANAVIADGDISFTATVAGTEQVVFSWDRFLPDDISRFVVMYNDDGDVYMSDLDEAQPNFTEFPEPPAGQAALNYHSFGVDLISATNNLLGIQGGGRCLTNGTNILDDTAHQSPGDVATMMVAAGTELALYDTTVALDPGEAEPHFECVGEALSNSVVVPEGGRALLFAVTDPNGAPSLVLVPVS